MNTLLEATVDETMHRKMMLGIVVAAICGCQSTPPAADTKGEHVLTGVVVRKEWSKSLASWTAGGSEYYSLKVEGSELPAGAHSTEEGVVLLPSETFPFEQFTDFAGVRVVCRGRFVAGERYVPPEDGVEQMPVSSINPITGEAECPVVGAGFQVRVIDPVTK